jgi:hypothetical protein
MRFQVTVLLMLGVITICVTSTSLSLLALSHRSKEVSGSASGKCELSDDSMFALYVHIDDVVELARQQLTESMARITVEACK